MSDTEFSVRKGILPGNSKSLWKAVKIAKNIGYSPIPNNKKVNKPHDKDYPVVVNLIILLFIILLLSPPIQFSYFDVRPRASNNLRLNKRLKSTE